MRRTVWMLLGALGLGCAQDADAPPSGPDVEAAPRPAPLPSTEGGIAYVLRFPEPHAHTVEVEATFPSPGPELELMMATWTPGSYLVREYARHVETLDAFVDGQPAPVRKTTKNRWVVDAPGDDPVVVRYRLYARETSVRSNLVEADLAVLNGAPTFLTPVGRDDAPRSVRLELPPGWSEAVTALPAHPEGEPNHWLAPDYDTLVDSPIVAGNPQLFPFEVDGVPHVLVNLGGDGVWDGPRSAVDVERIVREQLAFWGDLPYERYAFLNVIAEAGGGLEHLASTLMLTSRWSTGTRDGYRGWLGLVSHEFFHTWNVKRLRPEALGPFDYEHEVYTPDLWIAEGVTSYYDDLLLARAGLIDRDEWLAALSRPIEQLQTAPGRHLQSLSRASHDAWIEHYRPDENSPNTTVSYYGKGAVVGFLLDAEIRRQTDGARSLDDVLRGARARWSGERGFRSSEFRALASEIAGRPLGGWFARYVDGTDELDYGPALAWYGLRFAPPEAPDEDGVPGWLGARLDESGGRIVVTEVRRGTPAHDAGLSVGDEILAIGDLRVPAGGWSQRMRHYPPDTEASLLVARREKLRRLPVTFGAAPTETWKLEVDPDASARAKARLDALLASSGAR